MEGLGLLRRDGEEGVDDRVVLMGKESPAM